MAAGDIIYYSQPNIYGRKFRCSKRTAAHLDRTKARLKRRGKGETLRIIQGSYNTGVDASAGTHDYDAVIDVEITGMTWYQAQKWLRQNGWAAWVRTPAQGFSWHIHMVSLPPYKLNFVARVGEYVPGQVNDYYARLGGLVGYDPDETWFPDNIRKTIFNYKAYLISLELAKIREKMRILKRLRDRLRRKRDRIS